MVYRWMVIVILGGWLSACGASQPAAVPAPTAPGQSGVTGRVVSASDVAGHADQPLVGQLVLALPLTEADRLLGAGTQALSDRQLRFLRIPIASADPSIQTTSSDAQGHYTLALPAGSYLLCVADAEQPGRVFPATTAGCVRLDIEASVLRTVDLSRGFGDLVVGGA